jgi:uncharacterized membrane protein
MWGLAFYVFLKLPATIPTHFNGSGEVDHYGDKKTVLILPIIATAAFFGLTQLNRFPHLFNYMTKITEENAEKQYCIATRMLRVLKLLILLVFTAILLFTYLTTIGATKGLGVWFVPLTIGLFLIPAILSITKSLKAK